MTNANMDDVLQALRDELAAVSPSPEFQARVRQRVSGELDLLREELAAVAPSPAFAVRVRQGIDEAQAARAASWWSFFGWRWVVPAAAAAAIVVAIVVSLQEKPTVEQVTAQVTPAPVRSVAASPQTTRTAPVQSTTSLQPVGRRPQPSASTTRVASARSVAAARPSDPFLEVITNEPAILRANRNRIRAAGEARETAIVTMAETNPEIVVAPVEVSPIVVKWMVEPPPSPSGGAPVIRRVTADMAERSAK